MSSLVDMIKEITVQDIVNWKKEVDLFQDASSYDGLDQVDVFYCIFGSEGDSYKIELQGTQLIVWRYNLDLYREIIPLDEPVSLVDQIEANINRALPFHRKRFRDMLEEVLQ